MKRVVFAGLGLVLVLGSFVPGTLRLQARSDFSDLSEQIQTKEDQGVVAFSSSDWGALNADTLRRGAVPWKLTEAALALQVSDGDVATAATLTTAELFRPFGLIVPDTVANWPGHLPAPKGVSLTDPQPLGLVRAQSGGWTPLSLEIGTVGCAACHASVTYDADGRAQPQTAWLGGTNASLDLDRYTDTLFRGVLAAADDPTTLFDIVKARNPDLGLREAATLRWVIWPLLLDEMQARFDAQHALLPFIPSHVGATNGFDALRLNLGVIDMGDDLEPPPFVSIPSLGDRTFRTRLLAQGIYVPTGTNPLRATTARDATDPAHLDALAPLVSYFLVPSTGLDENGAALTHDTARAVLDWLATYEPQPFPGPIDTSRLAQGRSVYASACASCHGTYDASLTAPQLVRFPNWEGDVGTAPGVALTALEELAEVVTASPAATYLAPRATPNRSAPPLAGLWASAPYLANGSVPTLWHLMRPATRPDSFWVGGQDLDLARVGLAATPAPWSIPRLYDTSQPINDNNGHAIGFQTLTEADKDALLEYLKLL
ncbi:MAG: cytochrome c [Pseudomonadota bacterium]